MSENKDAQYREEFEKFFRGKYEKHRDGEYIDDVTHRLWIGYLAGRKKGEEEVDALNLSCDTWSELWCKQERTNRLETQKLNEEVTLLKKDIEELKENCNEMIAPSTHKAVVEANSRAYIDENQKLRSLIERAIELEGITFPDKKNQWLKEVSEVLK